MYAGELVFAQVMEFEPWHRWLEESCHGHGECR